MKCHYDILELEKTATDVDIKKSYRKLALVWHPDKNPDNVESATQQMLLIQQAYDVLSDKHERAWYDRHREQILRGGIDEDYKDNCLNLFQFFTTTCYKGYKDGEKGFYAVYNDVFSKLLEEDSEFVEDRSTLDYPPFGDSTSDYEEVVAPFYAFWNSYCTVRSYVWLDRYDIRQADNRRILRAMEKENKKLRDAGRKERNEEVRELVGFVRKRDPRVKAYRKILEEKRREQREKAEEHSKEQRKKHLRAVQDYKPAAWNAEHHLDDLDQIEAALDENFGLDSDDEEMQAGRGDDENSDVDENDLFCVACEKAFKSDKAFKNHQRAKKHLENVALLKEVMLAEEFALLNLEAASVSDPIDGSAEPDFPVPVAPGKKSKKAKRKQRQQQRLKDTTGNGGESNSSDEDGDEETLKQFLIDPPAKENVVTVTAENGHTSELSPNTETKCGQEKTEIRSFSQLLSNYTKCEDVIEPIDGTSAATDSGIVHLNGQASTAGDGRNLKDVEGCNVDGVANCDLVTNSEDMPTKNLTKKKSAGGKRVGGTRSICLACNAEFPSKSRLFDHLKETGHAVIKNSAITTAPVNTLVDSNQKVKNKKKKR